MSCRILFEVRNTGRICFWLDRLCRDVLLMDEFPSLFAISGSKEA